MEEHDTREAVYVPEAADPDVLVVRDFLWERDTGDVFSLGEEGGAVDGAVGVGVGGRVSPGFEGMVFGAEEIN